MPWIVLPPHEGCGAAGLGGVIGGVAVCEVRRTWRVKDGPAPPKALTSVVEDVHGRGTIYVAEDTEGCGERFVLCGHGQRVCGSCLTHRPCASHGYLHCRRCEQPQETPAAAPVPLPVPVQEAA